MAKHTESFSDAELFKRHTPASFQRLFGNTNGQPKTTRFSSLVRLCERSVPLCLQRFWGISNGQPETPVQRGLPAPPPPSVYDRLLSDSSASRNGTTPQVQPCHTPASAACDDRTLFSILGTDLETGEVVGITAKEHEQALACFGAIGSGKSTLARSLIFQAIRQNRGVVLCEPHGDLTRAVLAGLPESSLDRVVWLSLTDCATAPIGFNPFQCDNLQDAAEVAKCADFVHHTFMRSWDFGLHTPVLAMVLRHVTRLLIENPGSSFADIPLLFHSDMAREKLVSNVKSPQTRLFWEQYNQMSPRERRELISSTENKIDAYLSEPLIANILSQAKTTIDFGALLNRRAIVLINLSPQLEEISRLLGSFLLGRILMSAYQRASVPESERVPCYVFVDEWSRFCSDDLAVLIAESRKFKVIIGGLFNQTLETISDSNRATALQVGTLVTFRVSGDDSRVLARSYSSYPEKEQIGVEPIRAPVTGVVSHLVRLGHANPIVGAFVSDYLRPLDALIKTVGHSNQAFEFGCTLFQSTYALQGQRLLDSCLYECMQRGRADLFIPPLVLFTLGGAAEPGITAVFYDDIKRDPFFTGHIFHGLYESANRFGQANFLHNTTAVEKLLKKHAKRRLYDTVFTYRETTPGPSFIAMLKSLRRTMEILATEPILMPAGQYQPVYRQRTYADMENQLSNLLSSELPNFHARVRLPSGREHTIRTLPALPLLPEAQINDRIRQIKQRMREQGLCRPADEVAEEVRRRHEWLRQRNDPPPPASTTGRPPRRLRQKPPPAST